MAKLFNIARMTTATSGTGTMTLGSAVSGFLTFALAGVANGDVVTYTIEDGVNREIGRGTYTSAGTTLSRDTVLNSTNAGAKISLSGAAEVFIDAAAQDIQSDVAITGGSISGVSLSLTSLAFSADLKGTGEVSADITANQTDYAPTGHATTFHFRLNPDADRTINSLDGGALGRMILISNRSAFTLTLTHDDGATGTAAMRFLCIGNQSAKLQPNTTVWAYYDNTSLRWRVMNMAPSADQAAMEAASATSLMVTPVGVRFSPFSAKVWARIAGAGSLTESANMTSVTDTGTGDVDGTIATDFSTATWSSFCSIVRASWDTASNFVNQMVACDAKAAGTFGLQCVNFTTSTTAANTAVALADPATDYSFVGFGDSV